jgi:hypothetical protein
MSAGGQEQPVVRHDLTGSFGPGESNVKAQPRDFCAG